MHKDCHPLITAHARCQKFECSGGEAHPFQHDRLWVELPLDFDIPNNLVELHDRFLAQFPKGGDHKWKEVIKTPAELPDDTPWLRLTLPLRGYVLDRLDALCRQEGYERAAAIRGILTALLSEDERHATASIDAWRKLIRKIKK